MRKAIDWGEVKARLNAMQAAIEQSLHPGRERLAAVFKQRAERLARSRDQAKADDVSGALHVLGFRLGADRYAIEVSEVAEILPMGNFSPVPAASPALVGVFNLRGEIVPIIDLAAVLGLPVAPDGPAGYVILLRQQGYEVALKVGDVNQIRRIPPEDVSPASEIAGEHSKHFFKGITRDTMLILSMDAVRTHDVFQAE